MSILATSPTNTRMFDAEIAAALGDINAAVIVQQLNYWMNKDGVGTTIDGTKYVYNTFVDWVNQQFPWLSVWQFRKAMTLLRSIGIVKVIRHKAKQWNQTNYYSLNSDRLVEFLNPKTAEARKDLSAESTEMVELCNSAPQDDNSQLLEMRDSDISLYESKSTSEEKQQSTIAAPSFQVKKERSDSAKLSTSPVCENGNVSSTKQNVSKDKNVAQVDYIINLKWKEQIKDLDSAGIPVNKTLIKLLKSYKFEQVESAIALFKTRKREQHIPNPSGYFVTALKENWTDESVLTESSTTLDRATIFRHWYDLARELGYCSGQEVRDNEQWVCLTGAWEKWEVAVERGYSLDYLKKIVKRNGGR